MRRIDIGEASPGHSAPEGAAPQGRQAVVLAVRSGEVTVVVPRGTPDAQVLQAAESLRTILHLENEAVLTLDLQQGAVGASFQVEMPELGRARQARPPTTAPQPSLAGGPALARDLMKTEMVTASPEMPVLEAAALMAFHRISGLPVVVADGVVGVVSQGDVMGEKQGRTVGDIMTRDVISVTEDTPAEAVATLLAQRRIRRVPVVRGGRLVGIVSRGDLVRWLAGRASAGR